MKRRINVPLAFFSLVIAMTLWIVVYAQEMPTSESITLAVSVVNPDKSKWLVSDYQRTKKVSFLAAPDRLDEIKVAPPTLDVDLSNAKEGKQLYPADLNPAGYVKDVVDQKLLVEVTLAPKINRTVPVDYTATGKLPDEYSLQTMQISPKKVIVTGPKADVEKITHCIATIDLDQVNSLAPTPQAVIATPYEGDKSSDSRLTVDPVRVQLTPVIIPAAVERSATISPQFIGQPAPGYVADGYSIQPTAVSLTGDPKTLAATTVVYSFPIDVTGLDSDHTFKVQLRVPLNLKVKGKNLVTVRYHVKPQNAPPSSTTSTTSTNDFPAQVPPLNSTTGGAKGGGP